MGARTAFYALATAALLAMPGCKETKQGRAQAPPLPAAVAKERVENLAYLPGETWEYEDTRGNSEIHIYEGRVLLNGCSCLKFKQIVRGSSYTSSGHYYYLADTDDLVYIGHRTVEGGKEVGRLKNSYESRLIDRPLYAGKRWKMNPLTMMEVTSKAIMETPAGEFDYYKITAKNMPGFSGGSGLEICWSDGLKYVVAVNSFDAKTGAPLHLVLTKHYVPKQ